MPRKRRSQAARSGQGSLAEVLIPEKDYFRIGEVSDLTQTKSYVLRFWETEFPMLKPVKSSTGHRLYRREDVQTILEIKRLLYEEGYTIEGARKELAKEGAGERSQKELFKPRRDGVQLSFIRRELQGILTMLSRKC
ncbi:MAG: MerR family transcriptional regulator [Acidobacteria bacterium]|nr:MerR family transcriptional regulator [Acidobacteriota bacterium]